MPIVKNFALAYTRVLSNLREVEYKTNIISKNVIHLNGDNPKNI